MIRSLRPRTAATALAAAAAACFAVLAAGWPAAAETMSPGSAPRSVWGPAKEAPGTAALNSGGRAQLAALSCSSPGNCGAAGSYTDSGGHTQIFVADKIGGAWHRAQELPGSATLNADGNAVAGSLSCASPGNCGVAGYYTDGLAHTQALVANEVNGVWQDAREVRGTPALNVGGSAQITSISCPSAGDCAAGGYYTDGSAHTQAFVADEANGAWGSAQEAPGTSALNTGGHAEILSTACPSAGNCAAGGYYLDGSGRLQAFVADEAKGVWGDAEEAPGTSALNTGGFAEILSIACASAGNCAAGGYYAVSGGTQAFVIDETHGTWGSAREVPGIAAINASEAQVDSVSCAAVGNCSAGGYYTDGSGRAQAFVASESGGVWGDAAQVPGTAALNAGGFAQVASVSCAKAGDCSAGGYYEDGSSEFQAFVVDEVKHVWGSAREAPGTPALNTDGDAQTTALSCGAAGNCSAGGFYQDGSGHDQAFVLSEKPTTTTTLKLSAATVTRSNEHAERFTVKVASALAGTPAGRVRVKAGRTTLCVIRLAAGHGSCRLPARKLAVGRHPITAAYGGSPAFLPSTSHAKTLKIAK